MNDYDGLGLKILLTAIGSFIAGAMGGVAGLFRWKRNTDKNLAEIQAECKNCKEARQKAESEIGKSVDRLWDRMNERMDESDATLRDMTGAVGELKGLIQAQR